MRWPAVVRWGIPLIAGLALIGSSVACGAGQFRFRSAGAEPLLEQEVIAQEAIAQATPTGAPSPRPIATLSPTDTPAPTAAPVKIAVVEVKALRLRGGPGTEHPIVAGLRQGQELEALEQNDDATWLHVKAGDKQGWVAAEFVRVTEREALPGQEEGPSGAKAPAAAPGIGLGVGRAEIQRFYEELGFVFEQGFSPDGQEQVSGANHTRQATVILTGPESDLTATGISAVTRFDQETMVLSAAYLMGFASRVLPGWVEGPQWVTEHLREAKNGTPASLTAGSAQVDLNGDSTQVTLTFTVR